MTATPGAKALGVALLLMACWNPLPGTLSGQAVVPTANASEGFVRPPQQSTRPFEHWRHEAVACTQCHGAGSEHRTIRVRSSRDCASCHHVTERARGCTSCHSEASLAGRRAVETALTFTASSTPRMRTLTFEHARHLTASTALTCTDCHATEVTLVRNRDCASCHASHHGGGAECATCHETPKKGVHGAGVHLSCAGTECHSPARAPLPTLSRSLCLVCHPDRRSHEPGGDCATCHRIPVAGQPARGR